MQNAALWRQFEGQWVDSSYRLGPLIGVGGFGAVFHADHIVEGTLMRSVAVKLIPPDPESCDRQLGELIAATNLRHPDLLSCFHAGSAAFPGGKLLYLVMELAGESLQTRLEHGHPCSPEEAAVLMEHIASALLCLHQQRRVHRDVKPGNVLLAGDTWKLSDFGSLRASGAATTSHTGMVIGTMRYMPPESFEGIVSPAWDIWSLGALLIEALTGKPPYPDSSDQQLMYQILHGDLPPALAALPAPFDDLARRCLVKDHRARWNAAQVLDALQQHRHTRVAQLRARAAAESDGGQLAEALATLNLALRLDPANPALPSLIAAIQEKQDRAHKLEQEIAGAVAARDYKRAAALIETLRGTPAPAPVSTATLPAPRPRKIWWWSAAAAIACIAVAAIAIPRMHAPKPKPAPPPVIVRPAEIVPAPPRADPAATPPPVAPPPDPAQDRKAQLKDCRALIDAWKIAKALDSCATVQSGLVAYDNNRICWEGSLTGLPFYHAVIDACQKAVRSSRTWQMDSAWDSRAVNEALRGDLSAAARDFQAVVDDRGAYHGDTDPQPGIAPSDSKPAYYPPSASPAGLAGPAYPAVVDWASMKPKARRAAFVEQIRRQQTNPITPEVIAILIGEGYFHPAKTKSKSK